MAFLLYRSREVLDVALVLGILALLGDLLEVLGELRLFDVVDPELGRPGAGGKSRLANVRGGPMVRSREYSTTPVGL
jgi:hypothetical protein